MDHLLVSKAETYFHSFLKMPSFDFFILYGGESHPCFLLILWELVSLEFFPLTFQIKLSSRNPSPSYQNAKMSIIAEGSNS